MTKINDGGPAFPQMVNTNMMYMADNGVPTFDKEIVGGASLRQLYAGLALHAIISHYMYTPHRAAKEAAAHADALIAELAEGGGE